MKMQHLLIGLLCGLSVTFVQAETLTFGVVPQQSASTLAKLWTPIAEYLSQETGHDVRFATAQDIPTFERRLVEGEYDIAYMNPYHYTVFSQVPGYRAFAKQQDKEIKGIIVVHKDSPIQSLEELAGQRLAFPSPAAFAASVLPRAKMTQDGIDITPQYVSSHDSVYLTVSKGLFPAGGGVVRTFNNTDPAVRDQLRVLWTTPGYTSHAIAAHPKLSEEVVSHILSGLLSMNDNEAVKSILDGIGFSGFEAARGDRWDDVRALDIKLLDDLIQ